MSARQVRAEAIGSHGTVGVLDGRSILALVLIKVGITVFVMGVAASPLRVPPPRPGTEDDPVMKLYSDLAGHRLRQVAGDALLLIWVYVWVSLAGTVHHATLGLAEPGRKVDASASGLAGRLRDAGDKIGGVPYVGDDVKKPFDGAGDAADGLAAAGRSQVEAVHHLAFWLGLVVALIPILVAAAYYLPQRLRFVRRATAGRRFLDSAADLDLFALRAMANQPLHVLGRVTDDPAGAWRVRDPVVLGRLAALELRDCGLRPPTTLVDGA